MTQTNKQSDETGTGTCCGVELGELMSPQFFKALADPNRIAIVAQLAQCCTSWTVSRIAEALPVDISVVSRHLAQLRDAGILSAERRGKEVHYTLRYDVLVRSLRELADAIETCCPPDAADRLVTEIEDRK